MANNEQDDKLFIAATRDEVFNGYDVAFIFKDLFLSVVPSVLSGLASAAIIFLPLTDTQQGLITVLNAPAGYYAFKRNSPLEKIVKDKRS